MPIDSNFRAEVQAFSSKQGVNESFAEATRQEGLFEGQNVKELDLNSLIADSAEEIGFALSEKVEKKLSERKAGSKEALRASATEIADAYVNLMGDTQAPRKLHEFLEALKGRGNAASEADIRQLVGEHFKDPSDQFAALSFAEEALAKEGGRDPLIASLKNVKAQLLKEAGSVVRSGLNISADVLAYAKKGLSGSANLRDLYRFTILGGQPVAAIYTALMERYGAGQFFQSLDFLLRAAGSDLDGQTLGPSLEPTQLKAAVDDIYHVQSLGNTHRSLNEVLEQTRRLFPS